MIWVGGFATILVIAVAITIDMIATYRVVKKLEATSKSV